MDSIMNALKDEGCSKICVVVSVVSQTVDLRKIQGDITHGLGVELTSTEVQDCADDLCNVLNDQGNILLILDDLLQTIDLSSIGITQYSESCKCNIVITTRQMNVCNDLDRRPAITIHVLTGDDPWILFSQKAGDILKLQLYFIEIGKKIIEECSELPIALSMIESALRNKDLSYWQSAATCIKRSKNSSIQEDGLNSVVRRCIELSYNFLPNDMCKHLFLMCSFFPEDYNVPKETLTRHGMENWPRDTLTSSCEATSLMSNYLKKLPDGVHFPTTETLLLQDNKNLKLVPDEFFQDEKKKDNFQELLTLGGLTILKVDIVDVRCLPPDHDVSVAPNWERFDICVSGSEKRRLANTTQGASFSRGLATGVKLEVFPNWFRQAVAQKEEKLSYQICGTLSNILEEYHHGNFDGVKSLFLDQCVDIAQLKEERLVLFM
ncbi:hypothetical protein HAX54_027994 [Datura stramonium]|uniref:NB-ARC domain-containing protein n=1 Tax=Datura stramonium TaxID=4076 RepID=A0ABS8S954_DATST|nr:hypothetical protein [Datura stramonium]